MPWDCFAVSGDLDGATIRALRDDLRAFILRAGRDAALDCSSSRSKVTARAGRRTTACGALRRV